MCVISESVFFIVDVNACDIMLKSITWKCQIFCQNIYNESFNAHRIVIPSTFRSESNYIWRERKNRINEKRAWTLEAYIQSTIIQLTVAIKFLKYYPLKFWLHLLWQNSLKSRALHFILSLNAIYQKSLKWYRMNSPARHIIKI